MSKQKVVKELPSLDVVREWIRADVEACCFLLQVIRSDESIMNAIADHAYSNAVKYQQQAKEMAAVENEVVSESKDS